MAGKLERSVNVEHKYVAGQIVELTPNVLRAAAVGEYEIRQAMPASDVSSVSPRYRIKSAAEIYERIVAENELKPPKSVPGERQVAPEDVQFHKIEIR